MALRLVYQTARAVKIPIIGLGGIATADDAIEFLMAGAQAVQIGTANFYAPETTLRVIEGIRGFCQRKRVHLGEGTIELAVPQLRDTLEPFESVWLKAIGTRSKRLLEMIPMLYVRG
jgi:imidazole glycerol phosphate synthase subunit HisF